MMDDLPAGWIARQTEAIFRSFSGGTPNKGVPAYWNGAIPWLSSGDIKSDRIRSSTYTISTSGLHASAARLCRPGSVVIVVRSGILKHTLPVAILDFEAAINQDIKCFDSGDDGLNRWLAMALNAFSGDILAKNREGTTVQSVKYETLKSFQLPLPPPAEQHRIVAKLDSLLAKAADCGERLTRVSLILKQFHQSVLAAAASGRLTTDWRKQRDEADVSSDAPPQSWRKTSVGQIIEDLKYGTSQKCGYEKRGVPVLRIPNVTGGVIDHGDLKYAELSAKERRQLHLLPGDILVVRSNGSVSLVGTCALVGEKERGFSYAGYLIRIRPNQNLVSPEFLNLALRSYDVRLQIELEARSTSGVNNINSDEVRALRVSLPPLDEQKEIVRRVNGLFALAGKIEVRYRVIQKQLNRLPQSMLTKAFRGELVPTEAELAGREGRVYESAEQLLQRIQPSGGAVPEAISKKRAKRRSAVS